MKFLTFRHLYRKFLLSVTMFNFPENTYSIGNETLFSRKNLLSAYSLCSYFGLCYARVGGEITFTKQSGFNPSIPGPYITETINFINGSLSGQRRMRFPKWKCFKIYFLKLQILCYSIRPSFMRELFILFIAYITK